MNFHLWILIFKPIKQSWHFPPFPDRLRGSEIPSKLPKAIVSEQGFEPSSDWPQGPAHLTARTIEDDSLG